MDNVVLTPSGLWKDFVVNENFDEFLINEQVREDIIIREYYFNATKVGDGVTRVYAVVTIPNALKNVYKSNKVPAIVICNDYNCDINVELLVNIAKAGLIGFSFDYSGEKKSNQRYTIYPNSMQCYNFNKTARKLNYADEGVKNTALYQWSVISKFSVRFLKYLQIADNEKIGVVGIRHGGYFAWQLASLNCEIKCACSLFEGGWLEYRKKFKYAPIVADESQEIISDERERWIAGMPTQVYAQYIKIPFLYVGATNDEFGNFDRVSDTIKRIPSGNGYCVFSPRLTNMISDKSYQSIIMFLKNNLILEEPISLQLPEIGFFQGENGNPFHINVSVDSSVYEIKEVKVYICHSQFVPMIRDWKLLENVKQAEYGFKADIFDYQGTQPLFAFATVEYQNGIYLSSVLAHHKASLAKEIDNKIQEKMLYNTMMGTSSFVAINLNDKEFSNDVFINSNNVKIESGALELRGLTADCFALATYKISSFGCVGNETSILKFDINCFDPCELKVVVIKNFKTIYEERFVQRIILSGGNVWQKVEISANNLKDDEGVALKDWKKADVVCFEADQKFLLNNMIWL